MSRYPPRLFVLALVVVGLAVALRYLWLP